MKHIDSSAPKRPVRLWRRITGRGPSTGTCVICGRRAPTRMLVTNPRTLRREFYEICRRGRCSRQLKSWEGEADARRLRATSDWEHEHGRPQFAEVELQGGIPPQYPSLSRQTLRAFMDSGMEAATVATEGRLWTATALMGTIRALGFDQEVYAEIRSGQVVLRRVASEKTTQRGQA